MKINKIIIVIAVAAVGAFAYFRFVKAEEAPVMLVTETPVTGNIAETVTSTGTIQPVDTVEVGTQVSGTINKIFTDYNEVVKKGQLLATLDPTLMQANVDQIKGNLEQSNSTLLYQEQNFQRQKQLYDMGAISKSAYDNALSTFNAAKGAVASIKAQLASAQKNLNYTHIYAPIDGVVLSRSVSVGQTVAASFSTPTLFTLAKDIKDMQVLAKVDEADIGNIKFGERVTFTVDAYLNEVFEGTVSQVRLQPESSSNVVTYTTIINTRNDSLKLKPGMTATITIFTKEAADALIIPVKATKYTPDTAALGRQYSISLPKGKSVPLGSNEAYVWTLNGNQINRKLIKTGLNDNTQVQILSGVSAGDKIITSTLNGVDGAQAAGAASSPFMPKMPSRKKS